MEITENATIVPKNTTPIVIATVMISQCPGILHTFVNGVTKTPPTNIPHPVVSKYQIRLVVSLAARYKLQKQKRITIPRIMLHW